MCRQWGAGAFNCCHTLWRWSDDDDDDDDGACTPRPSERFALSVIPHRCLYVLIGLMMPADRNAFDRSIEAAGGQHLLSLGGHDGGA
jgi:hypothetical protein